MSDPEHNRKENFINWIYCPVCGAEIPEREKKTRFCVNCGLDLDFLREHGELPPNFKKYPPSQSNFSYPSYAQYPQYYRPSAFDLKPKLTDDEILTDKETRLWGPLASIGFPILGFILMNLALLGLIIIIAFSAVFTSDVDALLEFVDSPYFIIMSTFFELILILFPILSSRKYLANPTLKNSLMLMGFTTKGYDRTGVAKEVLIGIAFAVIGIFLVAIVSIATEFLLEFAFNINIIEESSNSPTNDADMLLSGGDILTLILMIVVMILIVGPSEEILFRGYMQRGLMRSVGKKAGISITAFIFGGIHLLAVFILLLVSVFDFIINLLLMFFPYLAISFLLGLLFTWRKGNLIAVIITHGVYDSITLIIAYILIFNPSFTLI